MILKLKRLSSPLVTTYQHLRPFIIFNSHKTERLDCLCSFLNEQERVQLNVARKEHN